MKFRNYDKFKEFVNVLIISHNDLDGIACGLVADYCLEHSIINKFYVGYDKVDETLLENLEGNYNWGMILVTDLSIKPETAKIVNEKYSDKVILIDHHPNLEWLNEYPWAHVDSGVPNQKDNPCGSSLLYRFFTENCNIESRQHMLDFVETVRRYDTYDWKNFYNDLTPKKLNDCMGIMGIYDFFDLYQNILLFKKPIISSEMEVVLKYKQQEIDNYIKTKDKKLEVKEIEGIKVGFVFAESHISELGNTLMELHPELGCVIMIDVSRNKVCIRSVKDRNVNCTEIAKKWYGGGGHHLSSGGEFPEVLIDTLRIVCFNKYL